jgi:sigma-54 specific flagellar transcriptional regulator A
MYRYFSVFRNDSERTFAQFLCRVIYANPFEQEEMAQLEQAALGVELPSEVHEIVGTTPEVSDRPELTALVLRSEGLAEVARRRLTQGKHLNEHDSDLYRSLVLFVLYYRFRIDLQNSIKDALKQPDLPGARATRSRHLRIAYYDRFAADIEWFLGPTHQLADSRSSPAHRFAIMFQLRRAFHFIDAKIRGRSKPIERLRATVWQSIFTHDMHRYDQFLHDRMHDITTLITGTSGTGKDLVAEAIGQSRYIHFDVQKKAFEENVGGAFHPVNLSAIPSELIEAELFGNCKGAFTGAVHDRVGWLELCGPFHSVFLDEIGELSQAIQVKLLRVLQNRTFQRVGETTSRRFEGKVIAATNRDLDDEMREGRFRRDFYYRLCSDRIRTPSLREQLDDKPDELPHFVEIIASRLFGDAGNSVAKEVVEWIDQNLPKNYAWPGNICELEQCIRNVLVRKEYHPPRENAAVSVDAFTEKLQGLQLNADELLTYYCSLVFERTGSYSETARRLNLDRRTVRSRVNRESIDE